MLITVWESVVPATTCTGEGTVAPLAGWQTAAVGFTELNARAPALAPVPLSATVWGLFAADSVIVKLPRRVPAAVGVNATLIVQLPLPANEAPQLLVCAKSPVA